MDNIWQEREGQNILKDISGKDIGEKNIWHRFFCKSIGVLVVLDVERILVKMLLVRAKEKGTIRGVEKHGVDQGAGYTDS